MEILKGVAVSPGVAIGEAFVLHSEESRIPKRLLLPEETEHEIERYHTAVEEAKRDVKDLQDRVIDELGDASAAIFNAHVWILSDPRLHKDVTERIQRLHFTPEYAVSRAFRRYAKAFRGMHDAYLSQRISDLQDVERRLLAALLGARRQNLAEIDKPVIVVAHDLAPSETANLSPDKVQGFATDVGGRTSHTAILARAIEIPAVVALKTVSMDLSGGDTVIIDGNRGLVIISPDPKTLERYHGIEADFRGFEESLIAEKDLPAVTTDGHAVTVSANIEFPEEVVSAVEHGAEGVGLYRTEFLYLRTQRMPSEEDHFEAYQKALLALGGRTIVIRTFDLGADKVWREDGLPRERNPFLGCRSLRLCQARPEIFRAQLRAIYRASELGDVRLMLPMIASREEIDWARGAIEDVKSELTREGTRFRPDVPVGIMIEVPSAAIMIDSLIQGVDFVSIGTNDLVQYTLAVDRTNEVVAGLYNPGHPAVIDLVARVLKAGTLHGVPVSMCGEMAGDPLYTLLLLGLGLDHFSVAFASIPEVKKIIRSISSERAAEIASAVRKMSDGDEINTYLFERTAEVLPGVTDSGDLSGGPTRRAAPSGL